MCDFISSVNHKANCIIPGNALGTNQIVIHEFLTIPDEKPDVEQVDQVIAQPKILETKVVLVKDMRCEQLLIKVIVKGVLQEKIIYTACKPEQPVHSAEFNRPFYGFVLLDFDVKHKNCECIPSGQVLANLLHVNVCIEDITIQLASGRKLDKFITALLIVTGNPDELVEVLT